VSHNDPQAADRVLVDVGIPTYGRPAYLAQAIESVLAQTFDAWQLTVSENGPGSKDVEAIVEPYLSDPRVRLAVTGRNIGGAGNSTRLIQTGRAPYVALLHDDDWWEPDFLGRRVAFLEANPTCGLVFSSCDLIDEQGSVVYRFEVDLPEGVQDRQGFLRTLYRRNVICIPTVLVPRWCYEAVEPEFSDSVLFHDYEMWLRIATRFDVGFLNVCDAAYRIHTAQTTHEVGSNMGAHRIALLDAVEGILPPDFPSLERRRARSGALLRVALEALERGDRRGSFVHLRRAMREYPIGPLDPKLASLVIGSMRRRALQRRLWARTSATK
jgi:glycosyltransferase involved in cell wall biosynthesis